MWAAATALVLLVPACGQEEADMSDDPTPTEATGSTGAGAAPPGVGADDIPVAHTPPGGWTGEMPPPVLGGCAEPLVDGAPDLRGTWEVVEVTADGEPRPDHRALGLRQRIEQCGDRLVVTAAGIVHDMRCDGTEEHGVHDVAEMDKSTPITVVATYEDGVHLLRPVGLDGVEIRRRRDGDQVVWDYLGFTARLSPVEA